MTESCQNLELEINELLGATEQLLSDGFFGNDFNQSPDTMKDAKHFIATRKRIFNLTNKIKDFNYLNFYGMKLDRKSYDILKWYENYIIDTNASDEEKAKVMLERIEKNNLCEINKKRQIVKLNLKGQYLVNKNIRELTPLLIGSDVKDLNLSHNDLDGNDAIFLMNQLEHTKLKLVDFSHNDRFYEDAREVRDKVVEKLKNQGREVKIIFPSGYFS